MKIFFRNIHLYLSLAAGLVIMTCCFSGAVLVFEDELQHLFHHDRYFVKQQGERLPLELLAKSVKQKYTGAKVNSIKVYADAERSVEISVSIGGKEKKSTGKGGDTPAKTEAKDKGNNAALAKGDRRTGGPGGGGGRASQTAFVNPYTGQVLELYSYQETFFYTMFSLHRWLLGGGDSIGKTITGVATFIFIFILITGIILWWPRNKAILKQRLKIKTDANFKRLNHDLHIVLGFYSSIFLFIFAFTALAWSFKWFNNGIYALTGSKMEQPEPPVSKPSTAAAISYDSAYAVVKNVAGDVEFYNLRVPNDSNGVFTATVLPAGAHESAADNYYIDQYSGGVASVVRFSDKNLGQRVRSTFKPIHVGSIFGLTSKIIAVLACLLGVTFPITGTIMWINRLKKKDKAKAAKGRLKTVDSEI